MTEHPGPTGTAASGAVHPDVLDPQVLLTHLDRVRPTGVRASLGRHLVSDDDWDEIRRVLAGGLDEPRARYSGVQSDRPPPTAFLPGHSKASIFQAVMAQCLSPFSLDEQGRARPFEHWLDEIKDLFRQFGPCDPRWVEVRLHQLLTHDRHPFVPPPPNPAVMADDAEVVLVGDWATGLPQAINVSNSIERHLQTKSGVDRHVIHLGDTYYCGLPEEYEHRFLPHWPVPAGSPVSSWALSGNHDMYTGGHGFFGTLLADPRFRKQQGSSNFVLRNRYWQLVGLDSAHQGPDAPGLSTDQQAWLRQVVNGSDPSGAPAVQTVLLSHHQAFTAFGDSHVSGQLAADVTSALQGSRVAGWIWGHEHRNTEYVRDVSARNYERVAGYTSTVGNGGVPQLLSTDGHAETTVDETLLAPAGGGWQFDAQYLVEEDRWAYGGFSVLSFAQQHLEISHFDETGALRHGPTEIGPGG